jgi:hypothetical protein
MRIPLLHADFEHGSFTKVSKAVRKTWPLGDLSLMQSQDVLAILLGYNSQHDARREALPLFSPSFLAREDVLLTLSMERMSKAVAWRMYVRFGIGLLMARALVSTLHLDELAVADITMEARLGRQNAEYAKRGIFVDEMWDYMNYKEPWPGQTPQLLARGIPPYRWAILPDRQVFEWSRMVSQIEMLPESFMVDLREAGRLEDVQEATVDEVSFMVDSLMPDACRPLAQALASGLEPEIDGAQPWQVKWIINSRAEVLGGCLVAEKLGGMVPRVFSANGAEVYEAMAGLLCGDSVPAHPAHVPAGTPTNEPLWLVDRFRLRWILEAKNNANNVLGDRLWDHERVPPVLAFYLTSDGELQLASQTLQTRFDERGQTCVATRVLDTAKQLRMLGTESIFETVLTRRQIAYVETALKKSAAAERGIPALGSGWQQAVGGLLTKRKTDVESVAGTPAGVERLQQDVTRFVPPAHLEAFVAREIDEALPLRYESDEEDNLELVRERRRAVAWAEDLGTRVLTALPQLEDYSPLALGYMVLVTQGEYPGSRNQYMAEAPAANALSDQARLVAAMLIYDTLSGDQIDWTALYCAIAPACVTWSGEPGDGTFDRTRIVGWYRSASAVCQELKAVEVQLEGVEKWRQGELETDRIRTHSGGQFLRAGSAIPVEKPRSPAESFALISAAARSKPITPVLVTQQLPEEFDAPGQGTSA